MTSDKIPYTQFEEYNDGGNAFNLKEKLQTLLFHWPLFVLCITACLTLAYIHLKSAVPIYTVKAKLLIKNGANSETALSERELFKSNNMLANEIEILKSRTLMKQVVSDLQLWVNYEDVGEYKTRDLYGATPIRFRLLFPTQTLNGQTIEIKIADSSSFILKQPNSEIKIPFYKSLKNQYGTWTLETTSNLKDFIGHTIRIRLNNPESATYQYLGSVSINMSTSESTVVDLTIRDQVPERAEDILNRLIIVYNMAAVEDKNKVSESSLKFIEDRLASITGELNAVEKDVEGYKSSRGLTDISSKSQIYLDNVKTNDAKLNEVQLQLQVINEIERYINSSDNAGIAPATVGITDQVLLGLINRLMALESQKDKLLATTPEGNPIFEPINRQINSTKNSISENIKGIKSNLRVTQGQLNNFNSSFKASIREIPGQEREFISIKRQQSIKEDLYIYLLQKREEAAVSFASTVSGSRVVDPAYNIAQESVNKPYTYALAFILGLILPSGLIFARDMLNNRIVGVKEIQKIVSAPILGELSFQNSDTPLVVNNNPGTIIGEQFRALRTNLSYVHGRTNTGKVTLLTSGMSGDGKSFVACNLGMALASTGRKTVILELDFRKPAISRSFELSNKTGISSYLIGQATIDEIIQSSGKNPNLFIIGAGPQPPNPSELLEQPAMEEVLNWLRTTFDEILIDTPPVLLVTDALILSRFSDAVLYVIRQNYTYKAQLDQLKQLHREQKLQKLNIIFNGVEKQENHYGYAYYNEEKKPALKDAVKGFLKRF